MKSKNTPVTAIIVASLAVSGGTAIVAQESRQDDRYNLKGPNGVAFSDDIRGYETWPAVAVSQVEGEAWVMGRGMKVIVANPTMIVWMGARVP
jgi:hypothetical protein